jgi:hypothetical protein
MGFFLVIIYLRFYDHNAQNPCFEVFRRCEGIVNTWQSVFDSDEHSPYANLPNIQQLGETVRDLRKAALFYTIFLLMIYMPIFCTLNHYYHTHYHSYAWTVSICFLSGKVPGLVLFGLFIVSIMGVHFNCAKYNYNFFMDWQSLEEKESEPLRLRRYGAYLLLFLFNTPIVIIINIIYVYIELNYERDARYAAQVFMAVFKMRWNEVVVLRMLDFAIHIMGVSKTANQHQELLFVSTIALINNIAVPFIATAGASSKCFLSLFQSEKIVKSSYQYTFCALETNSACAQFLTETEKTEFDPPFVYSYQCSSTLMTAYAAVTVYIIIVSALSIFIIYVPLLYIQTQFSNKSWFARLIDAVIPKMLRRMPKSEDITPETRPPVMFEKDKFVMTIIGKLALLMTFGAVFPPLGFVICFGIYRDTYFTQCLIGRLTLLLNKNGLPWAKHLDNECKGVAGSLRESIWLITPFVVSFYSFFVFDIYGDDVGFKRAIWSLFSTIAIPLVFSFPFRYYHARERLNSFLSSVSSKIRATSRDLEPGQEMVELDKELSTTVSPIQELSDVKIRQESRESSWTEVGEEVSLEKIYK